MGKFEKGHSKLGGRREGTPNRRTEIKDALEGYSNETGIPHLKELAKDPKTPRSLMVEIEKYLIDRELGRPRQATEVSYPGMQGPEHMTEEEKAATRKQLEELAKPIEPSDAPSDSCGAQIAPEPAKTDRHKIH